MKKENILVALIISIGVVVAACFLGGAFKNRNVADDTISVVGLGTVDFTSDEILWQGSFATRAMEAQEAYSKILQDKEKVKAFFKAKGFSDEEIKFGAVSVNKTFRNITVKNENNYETRTESIFDGYTAMQNVIFSAKKQPELMKKIEQVADETAELLTSGIEFNSSAIQYSYSDLPSLKHNLIEKATQDAKERAEKIIKTGDGNRGKLKTASMGVFQITGVGSNEEDSYGGNFDIYSKQKTARITVRLTYNLK